MPKTSDFSLLAVVRRFPIPIAFFASAILTWPILAEWELFEAFYEFSRAHEDWDLDELALLVVNLSVALACTIFYQWAKLKRVVGERDFQRRRAQKHADHDLLTGLMNRRAFTRKLNSIGHMSGSANTRVVAMIDLDRFKPINDLHGHAAGDATLKAVAERLVVCAGPGGTVARLGGDEFAVIFPAMVTSEEVERMARQFLLTMELPVDFEGRQVFASCSMGLVQWECSTPAGEVMRKADKALYAAKINGKGQFAWYDAELDQRSQERAEIEADLREAILASEIEPWFQPIIRIEDNRLVGFEVLARWTHKTLGPIPPDVFIGIAEDSGQISVLGMELLRKACMAANPWDDHLTISFNLSPHQFHDARLVEQIEVILMECDFDPTRLTVEVTENSVIRDFDLARHKLDALKALGVAVALDDFGTGYSSLASLRRLPFDRIKIDRSFVTDIASEPQNQRIVSGIMALADGLELDVTAEGIETLDDLRFLQSLECSLGQGYFFDRAVPAERVPWMLDGKWLENAGAGADGDPSAPRQDRAG